ncbi:B2 protein [Raphanus sativus]|uniref:B2 protein n=1 Tax=Raphanus sativus TaxID=3726 RepID=A0A6J0NIJ0_RAPSA|nr:B2 protein [Raphanus sativus]
MDNNNNQFWQFSDQLRVQTPHNLANLSLNDSIWSTKRTYDDRRNFDIPTSDKQNPIEYHNNSNNNKASSDINTNWNNWKHSTPNGFGPVGSKSTSTNTNVNFNHSPFNDTWKFNSDDFNGGFNKGIYSSPSPSPAQPKSYGFNSKNKGMIVEEDHHHQIRGGAKKNNRKNHNHQKNNNKKEDNDGSVDKRFKTLPPAEALPRNETIGGYVFVCNNDTMEENLKRQLFGLPPRYRDSVRAITPGLPLFLYNYSTHQLHGIYEAASFGGTNIELSAFEDKKCPGESRFPAQVRAVTRKVCLPLEEDSFRPILHHYDGPKFRLELSVPEVLSLLDVFAEQNP